jgi:biopolymer transport protein ExbB
MGVAVPRRRPGLSALFFSYLLALAFGWLLLPAAPPARAQDQPPPAESGDQKAAEATPAAPKAGGGGAPNMFVHMIKSVGLIMGFILGVLSISMVALVVLLFMDLRMSDSVPPAFVEEFTDTVNKRRFKEAYELARQDNSFLARVLTAGMTRLQYGIEDARDTAVNTVESIRASKEQLTTYLATIGTLGPLIGLVGTVYSMIGAFMKMADKDNPPKPYELADTLSHGLVVTLVGIALAVPAIFFHAFFRNRLTRISMEAANVADDLLTQMYHNSKRPAPAAVDARVPTAVAAKPAE